MTFCRYLFAVCCGSLLFCYTLKCSAVKPLTIVGVCAARLVNLSRRVADAQGKAISGIAGATFAMLLVSRSVRVESGRPFWRWHCLLPHLQLFASQPD